MRPTKACPVVLRDAGATRILVFDHPLAGVQLVKGTIEPGESAAHAAVRELREESGLVGRVIADLGTWEAGALDQVWSFQHCAIDEPPPETWTHDAPDDGGRRFRFRWHPLADDLPFDTHAVFRAALIHLRAVLARTTA
jgi:8-oxo-dGTP pyrophosphatase MutT (NUDIX family)